MVIIKTSDGDVFVNEKETVSVIHNRDEHTAYIYENEMKGTFRHIVPPIKHVESVNYINEQTSGRTMARRWKTYNVYWLTQKTS